MQENKKSKKRLIVIIVTVTVLLIAVAVIFILKWKNASQSEYGTIHHIEIVDDSTFNFSMSAVYSPKEIEYAVDKNSKITFYELETGKSFDAETSKIEYHQISAKGPKTATMTIEIAVNDFKFESGRSYAVFIPKGAVSEKHSKKELDKIEFLFSAEKQFAGGTFFAQKIDKTEYETVSAENEITIKEEDGKFYIVTMVKSDTLTFLNKNDIKKKVCGFTIAYQDDGIQMKTYFNSITSSFDEATKTVTVKCPVDKSVISGGTKYSIYISKGLLKNSDGTLGTDEMRTELTYMG